MHPLPIACYETMQHQRVMPHIQQYPFHLLLKTRLVWVAVHASGWTLRPGSHLTGLCCGVLTLHSQTTSIAGWGCSHYYAWYALHLAYVRVMLCCNCLPPLCEDPVLFNFKVITALGSFRCCNLLACMCGVQLALRTCCLQCCLCCVCESFMLSMSQNCWCA